MAKGVVRDERFAAPPTAAEGKPGNAEEVIFQQSHEVMRSMTPGQRGAYDVPGAFKDQQGKGKVRQCLTNLSIIQRPGPSVGAADPVSSDTA